MKTLDAIALSIRDRQAIERACQVIRQRVAAASIILFGSKARGEDSAESDIDLLIVTRDLCPRSVRSAIVDAVFDIELSSDVIFNLVFVDLQEWTVGRCSVLPIHREIELRGVAA